MKEILMRSPLWTIVLTIAVIGALCQSPMTRASDVHESFNSSATASPTPPDTVHPAFVVTESQLRKAFDDAELRGEKKQGINAGDSQTTEVIAQNPSGGTETLQMRILFTAPADQVALNGYSFGLVARERTPDDRKAFEDLWIERGLANHDQATFRIFFQQPSNSDATIPVIHFQLLDKNGHSISAGVEPTSFIALDRDVIAGVALEKEGQPLTFPIMQSGIPLITNQMTKMTLVIMVGDEPRQLNFKLP